MSIIKNKNINIKDYTYSYKNNPVIVYLFIPCDNETTYNFEVYDLHTYIAGGLRVHNDSVEGALKTGGSSAGGRGIGAASANMSTPIGQDSNKPTEAFKEARKAEKAIAEDANRELEVNSLPGTENSADTTNSNGDSGES